jgi:hypothetical protein
MSVLNVDPDGPNIFGPERWLLADQLAPVPRLTGLFDLHGILPQERWEVHCETTRRPRFTIAPILATGAFPMCATRRHAPCRTCWMGNWGVSGDAGAGGFRLNLFSILLFVYYRRRTCQAYFPMSIARDSSNIQSFTPTDQSIICRSFFRESYGIFPAP